MKAAYAQLPLSFEQNQGQTSDEVQFLSRGGGYTVFLKSSEAVLALRPKRDSRDGSSAPSNSESAFLQLKLARANRQARVEGLEELSGKTNYFIGNDPKKWRTNVPTYAKVRYNDVYPGVDLVYYGNQSGQLEYDFVVAPGADPATITFNVEERLAQSNRASQAGLLCLDPNGDLMIRGDRGDIRFQKPVVYQQDGQGWRHYIDGHYLLQAAESGSKNPKSKVSFKVAVYDHSRPLIIDPSIVYSTYLRGTADVSDSIATGIAAFTDPGTGHVYGYVTGRTCAPDFPTVNAVQSTYGGGCSGYGYANGDVFVTKFDLASSAGASVIYSTYLGGSASETATGIAVDSAGNAYITGNTNSVDFPIANAYQTALTFPPVCCGGFADAFVAKLKADGSSLLYSTYFGGSLGVNSQGTTSYAIALDSVNRAYIAGGTSSSDLPVVNPYQTSLHGVGDAFLAMFDTTRSGQPSLVYSTYLGGSDYIYYPDVALAIAIDATGAVHVGGYTSSSDFPIVNGFQSKLISIGGSIYEGAFYAKLNPAASGAAQLVYSTYLGGGDPSSPSFRDTVQSIALDFAGNAYLAGTSYSDVFPVTSGAFQIVRSGNAAYPDPFVTKVNPLEAGSASLIYSTYLLATHSDVTGSESASSIAVDNAGNAFVVGSSGPGIPLVNSILGSRNGVMQSIDGGETWSLLGHGLPGAWIDAMAVDTSTSPRSLYVGYEGNGIRGVFASTDGGLNWSQVLQLQNANVFALAVDPINPSNVYLSTNTGVYKSPDRGSTWSALNAGLSSTAVQGVRGLLFDSGTLYAGAGDGLYKLASGASSWVPTMLGVDVHTISVDPTRSPHILYTGSESSGAYKSTDGGATWSPVNDPYGGKLSVISVDGSTSRASLYAYDSNNNDLWTTTDGGATWNSLPDPGLSGQDLAVTIYVDTTTRPSTLYVRDLANGIFKSTDGGNSWTSILATGIGSIAVDTTTANGTPVTLYAGTSRPVLNAFVAELNPSGSALLFSTYLGGIASNSYGNAVAVNSSHNIYLAGEIGSVIYIANSLNFPTTINAFQSTAVPGVSTAAFFTELTSSGTTTTGLSSSPNPSMFGQTVTFTAEVSAASGTPTGTITFTDGNAMLGTASLASGQASITTGSLATGTHMIVASYGGDSNFNSSTSASLTQTVNPVTTTATLTSSLNPSVFEQPVTFNSTVTSIAGVPSGTVTFNDGATNLGTGTLNASGQATFATGSLSGGTHNITAVYSGSRNFASSTSSVLTQIVNPAATTTTVASSLNPSVFGQSVTFTATVTSGAGVPGGTVIFKDGPTVLGTGILNASGQASFATQTLGAGTHSISAAYGGTSNFAVSTSSIFVQTVSKASTNSVITSSPNPSILGQSVTFRATVTSTTGAIATGTVTFKMGSTVLGTANLNAAGQAMLSTSTLAAGNNNVTAAYGGSTNFLGSTSTSVTQVVQLKPTTTSLASSPNPSQFGQTVTFTASVSSSSGGTPTGSVTFKDGSKKLGSASLNGGGQATFSISTLSRGTHNISATYSGDSIFNASASATLVQTVN